MIIKKHILVLATNSEHKVKEYNLLFKGTKFQVVSLKTIGFDKEIIEDGATFAENSEIKALTVSRFTSLPVIADDSGLCINALPFILGVHSARFEEKLSQKEKNNKVLRLMDGKTNRLAKFVCVITVAKDGKVINSFEGETYGNIGNNQEGENGFGYDPIFISDQLGISLALATDEEKNQISHRGVAFKKLLKFLLQTKPNTNR